jgi:hypothetical protein
MFECDRIFPKKIVNGHESSDPKIITLTKRRVLSFESSELVEQQLLTVLTANGMVARTTP